jgi:Holliday junction resolvase RusA-like endonuclease
VPPDIDNLEKLVWDSLKGDGGCFADDGQITTCISRKRYGSPPRIEVDIEEDQE